MYILNLQYRIPIKMSNTVLRLLNTANRIGYGTVKNCFRKDVTYAKVVAKQYSSALFVSGDKAHDTFSVLSPFLDFDNRFANAEELQKELKLRGMDVDVIQLKKTWDFYKYVDTNKWALEHKRGEITNRMRALIKKKDLTPAEEQETVRLKLEAKVLKEDLKVIRDSLWELENSVVIRALRLPNELDHRTPPSSPTVLNSVGIQIQPEKVRSHIEIGRDLSLVEYRNPTQCYLCNDAALFELGALALAGNVLSKDDMIRVAGTDFSRSLIVEGCGLNHEDPAEAFVLEHNEDVERDSPNRLHLVGGASLVSFLAMHAKQLINPTHLPLKCFATGRQYSPFPESALPNGLFNICQASAAQAFIVLKESKCEEYEEHFQNLIKTTSKLYDSLDCHYRTVIRPAAELRPWESLRVSFEMWSPFAKQYIEVGHVSMCGDYFSKRLLICYQTATGRDFPAIISGTVLSVPRLLGCLLETHSDKFVIPETIAKHMPIDYETI